MSHVKTERLFYVNNRKISRAHAAQLEPSTGWATVEAQQHISIDAMRQLTIPTFGATDQPSPTYYHTGVSLTPMGVSDEGTGNTTIYCYDGTCPKTCSDSVVSCIDRYLEANRSGCKHLVISMDNCPVNKSYTV